MQVVFQDPYGSFNPRHKVERLVSEPLHLLDRSPPQRRAARARGRALPRSGCRRADMDKYPHEFSGGQRQRISIARALITRPKLIVADEPVSALDVSIRAQILDLFADLNHRLGVAYLFITHDLTVARAITDDVMVMHDGRSSSAAAPARCSMIRNRRPAGRWSMPPPISNARCRAATQCTRLSRPSPARSAGSRSRISRTRTRNRCLVRFSEPRRPARWPSSAVQARRGWTIEAAEDAHGLQIRWRPPCDRRNPSARERRPRSTSNASRQMRRKVASSAPPAPRHRRGSCETASEVRPPWPDLRRHSSSSLSLARPVSAHAGACRQRAVDGQSLRPNQACANKPAVVEAHSLPDASIDARTQPRNRPSAGAAAFLGRLHRFDSRRRWLITVPALLLAGYPPVVALGTNKLQGLFGSGSATLSYAMNGHVDLKRQLPSAALAFSARCWARCWPPCCPPTFCTSCCRPLLVAIALYFAFKPRLDDVDRAERMTPFPLRADRGAADRLL
jgi:energy-coupling factor transporter ATP-binding protein EcfA2